MNLDSQFFAQFPAKIKPHAGRRPAAASVGSGKTLIKNTDKLFPPYPDSLIGNGKLYPVFYVFRVNADCPLFSFFVFSRIDQNLAENKNQPFFVTKNRSAFCPHSNPHPVLNQKGFVFGNRLIDHLLQIQFFHQIILVHKIRSGVKKRGFNVVFNFSKLRADFSRQGLFTGSGLIVADQLDSGYRNLSVVNPTFNVFPVIFLLCLQAVDFFDYRFV